MYVYMYTCTYMYAFMCVYTYTQILMNLCVYIYTHLFRYICRCIDIYVCRYIHIYIHIYLYMCIYTHIQMCVCVCMGGAHTIVVCQVQNLQVRPVGWKLEKCCTLSPKIVCLQNSLFSWGGQLFLLRPSTDRVRPTQHNGRQSTQLKIS